MWWSGRETWEQICLALVSAFLPETWYTIWEWGAEKVQKCLHHIVITEPPGASHFQFWKGWASWFKNSAWVQACFVQLTDIAFRMMCCIWVGCPTAFPTLKERMSRKLLWWYRDHRVILFSSAAKSEGWLAKQFRNNTSKQCCQGTQLHSQWLFVAIHKLFPQLMVLLTVSKQNGTKRKHGVVFKKQIAI